MSVEMALVFRWLEINQLINTISQPQNRNLLIKTFLIHFIIFNITKRCKN